MSVCWKVPQTVGFRRRCFVNLTVFLCCFHVFAACDLEVFVMPFSSLDFPAWAYDGSSTGQAIGKDSDMHLKPVALYPDPFLGGNNKLVLCESYDHAMKPASKLFGIILSLILYVNRIQF